MERINIKNMMMDGLFAFMIRRAAELNACTTFLLVSVFRSEYDCTNGGVTSRHNTLFVPHPEGNHKRHEIDPERILTVIPPAMPGCPYRFRPEAIPKGKHSMMGGNYVCTSDSRFSEEYGFPIAVHDRVE